MEYKKRYETLRIGDNKPIGPLKIPLIPTRINPGDLEKIKDYISDKIRREIEEEKKPPYIPLIIPDPSKHIQ
ncbi:hypothetical protein KY343_04240 [Candidatus Woesearchaeota archaeon]|nr:hypothetical protein [Candidatus Woesearchaeota archaeon]